MDLAPFLSQAWNTLAHALADAAIAADLDLHPATLAKTVKRRCVAELRRLETLIRRLIFLMALSVELQPIAPREGRNYFREEDTNPAPRKRSFRIAPAASVAFRGSIEGVSGGLQPGPVNAAPVIARWTQLAHVWQQRDRRARLLARTLQRWQAKGEPKPYVLPMTRLHRFTPELGLIASALPMLINKALQDWPDTG